MNGITLTLRAPLTVPLDASGLSFDQFSDLDESAIARLQVRIGRDAVAIGDLFTVHGGRSSSVRVEGSCAQINGLGTGLSAADLFIDGDAGDDVGVGMSGGRIRSVGTVGHGAGARMRGGVLEIGGDAGDRLGAAGPGARSGMTGGEIIVRGSVGSEAGMRARRGLIVIGGHTGASLARDIIAGTVVAFGRVGPEPGRGNKRGSIVSAGGIDVPGTYRLACTFEPPFVRVLMVWLERRFGLAVGNGIMSGRFRRHCGDAGVPGKGEILEWIPT